VGRALRDRPDGRCAAERPINADGRTAAGDATSAGTGTRSQLAPRTEAELRPNVSPSRAAPIAQPLPEMVQANVSGAHPTLKALDAAAD
jgi:hypothetical protein